MPCDTQPQKEDQIQTALRRLESLLVLGNVTVTIGQNGALAFTNWSAVDRDGMQDLCAYRRLLSQNSWPLRVAIGTAEMYAGRQLDKNALTAGVHSHDGGQTWGSH